MQSRHELFFIVTLRVVRIQYPECLLGKIRLLILDVQLVTTVASGDP